MLIPFKYLLTFLYLLLSVTFAQLSSAEEIHPLAIVVSNNPEIDMAQQPTAHELSLIYWRKKIYWHDGIRVHPVNLHAQHPLRLYFSKVVLGSLPNEQADYWNGLYFHGITPPYSVQSQEAVIRYVAMTKGAIGYVDACKLDKRIKAVLWIEANKVSANKPTLNCPS